MGNWPSEEGGQNWGRVPVAWGAQAAVWQFPAPGETQPCLWATTELAPRKQLGLYSLDDNPSFPFPTPRPTPAESKARRSPGAAD